MALSQFSYGKMEIAKSKGLPLPVPGGYNKNGVLTTNAAEILESGRPLPISSIINQIIDDCHSSIHESESVEILYPGERVLKTRKENLFHGIPVNKIYWNKILTL
jgi:3-dehydro-L-gulonate 2-dehydrogenase